MWVRVWRGLGPRLLLGTAWLASLLLVYHCCRLVTEKVYFDIERALVQPKESPPLLGYLLLQRYYTPSAAAVPGPAPPAGPPPANATDVSRLMGALRCRLFPRVEDIPELSDASRLPLAALCRQAPGPRHFLTLFTTMYDRPDKIFIFNNTVTMWPQLAGVKPVLFLTPADTSSDAMVAMVTRACSLGWDVLIAPHCNNDSYPVLRSMWHVVLTHYDSTFYGYTNGDIVFSETLTLTLRHLLAQEPHIFRRQHLISGQRHNAYVSNNTVLGSMEEVDRLLYNTTLHSGIATDYFITTRDGFPWQRIPPFVIGRPQFDNWLIWIASHDPSVMDIDATETVLALHQGLKGTIASWSETNVSVRFNNEIAGRTPDFYVLHGCTYCMRYRLMNTVTSILVVPRQLDRRKYTCTVDGEEHIAFLQMRTDEALLTAYSKTVLTLDKRLLQLAEEQSRGRRRRGAS